MYRASCYFSMGSAIRYNAATIEEAAERACRWYELFVLDFGGWNTTGEKITAIEVLCPDGRKYEIEFPLTPRTV
jgi:hypothetical protein